MKHRIRAIGALSSAAALAALVPAPTSVAAPGDLDPTFGNGGVVAVDAGTSEWATDVAIQPDGKIVGVGSTDGPGPDTDALVFRLNADGTPDPQFGIHRLDGAGGGFESASALAVQPDGKIVVAGRTSKNADGAVWRLLPTGAPDPSFGGGDGFVPVDSGGSEVLTDVALAPGGAIVLAGETTVAGQATIYRLTPAGDFDDSFDMDGALGVGNNGSRANAVAVQPDGRILVAGFITPSYGMVVRRLTVDGAADPTFGGGYGVASNGTASYAFDLALQPDGRIVVAGLSYNASIDAHVLRYTADGMVDTSFGSAGASVDLGGAEELYSVALASDGAVVATGATDAGQDAIVVRLDPQGRPDPAFGVGGAIALPGSIQRGEGVGVQPDGDVVVTGGDEKATSSAVVYRLLGDYRSPVGQPPTCHGKPATIIGTPGKDRIKGTKRADVIVALGGNDVVKGLGGNDLVCAGDGNDLVQGGPGKDRLLGERGKDRLVGGTGKDRLVGGPQKDHLTQ